MTVTYKGQTVELVEVASRNYEIILNGKKFACNDDLKTVLQEVRRLTFGGSETPSL